MKYFKFVLFAVFIASVHSERSIAAGERIDGDQVVAVQHRSSEFFLQPSNYTYVFDYKGNGQIFNITAYHVQLHASSGLGGSNGIILKEVLGGFGETFIKVTIEETNVLFVNSVMRIYGFK